MCKIYFLFVLALMVCTLSSCQKDNNGGSIVISPSKLIVGKWNLQKENISLAINGVTQVDTSFTASSYNKGYALFNSDNTFVSVGYSEQPINIGSLSGGTGGIISRDSTTGIYNFSNSTFTLNAPIAGFGSYGGAYLGTTTTTDVPVISNISKSVQITQLTGSSLTLHSELMYTSITSAASANYKTEQDFFYTK